jgi:hypothetical protein
MMAEVKSSGQATPDPLTPGNPEVTAVVPFAL